MTARAVLCLVACVAGWACTLTAMRYANPMFASFLSSKFGRTLIAMAAGALAPAVPSLVIGDTHAFRMAIASACGALVTAVALHFRAEGAS